jgi:hypothetical protein
MSATPHAVASMVRGMTKLYPDASSALQDTTLAVDVFGLGIPMRSSIRCAAYFAPSYEVPTIRAD